MLQFHDITLEDRAWMQPLLEASGMLGNDYAFPNIYNWRFAFNTQAAHLDGFLVLRFGENGQFFLYPAGSGDVRPVIEAMLANAAENGLRFIMRSVETSAVERLAQLYPGRFVFTEDRDSFDYVYSREKLASLSGKKLHHKRTAIHHFLDECPDWSYEPITEENLPECLKMNDEWCRLNHCFSGGDERHAVDLQNASAALDNDLGLEHCAVRNALLNFFALDMLGGMLRVNGRVVAITAGERHNGNSVLVNVEKAFLEPDGCYAMINNQFAKNLPDDVLYINREDDVGDEGLRQSKLSYKPDLLVEKYTVTLSE